MYLELGVVGEMVLVRLPVICRYAAEGVKHGMGGEESDGKKKKRGEGVPSQPEWLAAGEIIR